MLPKYYQKTSNLKEIIKREAISEELDKRLNNKEHSLMLNKRSLNLDIFMFIIGIIFTIISAIYLLPASIITGIISIYSLFCYHADKINISNIYHETTYLTNLKTLNNASLAKLRQNNELSSNYILEAKVAFSTKDKEAYLLNLEKQLLLITYYTKHKNKLMNLYLNNNLKIYLNTKNYTEEDILFIMDLINKDLTSSPKLALTK